MITLYSTVGCHLCEQAYALLEQIVQVQDSITVIDIALDDALFERFGTTIPVVEFDDHSLLSWPFSASEIQSKLSAKNS